jgi:DNA modification methylase
MSSSSSKTPSKAGDFPKAIDLSDEFRKYIGKQVSYATHGIHKYPAKFIPQIPRFCIEAYSDVGDVVLDPFMGSGTTLLESFILGRSSYGIDIHPLARLIAKVKTTPLDPGRLSAMAEELLRDIRSDRGDNRSWIPEIHNCEHWFKPNVLYDLATIKKNVWGTGDGNYRDFFKICFSSIIRKVSNSDDDSLIPEVTSFQKKLDEQGKTSYDSLARFENTVKNRLMDAADLYRLLQEVSAKYRKLPKVDIIGNDARDIALGDGSVDLAVTSPPYASAVHYVSVHKLEMQWLGLLDDAAELDGRVVGTARAYVNEYRSWEPSVDIPELKSVLVELMQKDRKSAFIVYKYFEEMRKNFCEVNRVLRRKGRYCVIVGENTFRKVRIPTYRILSRIAERSGFDLEEMYVYDVINRHLDIPRWNESRIERDHILVLGNVRRTIERSL